ncbi:hypothetical protein BJY52DRAFT_1269948 [Lactarius psammicola]|nr:hypothetical protein BJY52DRAFT_1269948 [Lactarius psammicola]
MADTSCAGILPNPDLVGIGTRFNFYVTILLGALIPAHKRTTGLLDELFKNSIFYGLALFITALVQTVQGRLDLYHAIFVMQVLVCFVILHLYSVKRFILPDSDCKFAMKITIAFQVLQVLVFIPWSFYVWTKDERFGPQPECNNLVKYVFFFVTIQATARWRRVLAFLGLAAGVIGFCVILITMFIKYIHRKSPKSSSAPPFYMGVWWVVSVLCAAYSIVITELIVHRNHPNVRAGENDWGFGQIVSVVLILPIIIEIVAIIVEWNSQKDKEQTEEVCPHCGSSLSDSDKSETKPETKAGP